VILFSDAERSGCPYMKETDKIVAQVEECVRFEIHKAVIIKIIDFWDVTPYNLVNVYQNISTHLSRRRQ
jgi:hypothetical protein